MSFSAADQAYMSEALRFAARGRGRTHPNPMVGCLLINTGEIVGSGFRRSADAHHAELAALEAAGAAAKGATAYINLEPCTPCADALIAAGVSRVVVAMLDPDSQMAGQGIARLRAAGVTAEVGLMQQEAKQLNRAYVKHRTTGRPLVILKWAMTLDGKIACYSGDSRWVTGDTSRDFLHQIRDQVDAILVGENTVRRDDPELTARPKAPGPIPNWAGGIDPGADPEWLPKDPLRVILDTMARSDLNGRLFSAELQDRPMPNKTLMATTKLASPIKLQAIKRLGAEYIELPEEREVVSLGPLLDELGRRGITSLLVEGGSRVHWSFLSQGLADYMMVFVAPKVIGGANAAGPVAGQGLAKMAAAWRTSDLHMSVLGEDVLLEGDFLGEAEG